MLPQETSVPFQEFQVLRDKWQLGVKVSSLDSRPSLVTNVYVTLGRSGHCAECQFHPL